MDFILPPSDDGEPAGVWKADDWNQDPPPEHCPSKAWDFPPDVWVEQFVKAFNTITPEDVANNLKPPQFVLDVEKRFVELGFTAQQVYDQNIFHELFYNNHNCLMILTSVDPVTGKHQAHGHTFLKPKGEP